MSNPEKTFADRLGRGNRLLTAVNLFNPAFAPADEDIAPDSFGPYLESLEAANLAAGGALDVFRVAAGERTRFVKELKPLTTRIVNHVKSNKAWNNHLPSLKSLADKLRGRRTRQVAPPATGGDTEEQTRARQSGEQSFAEIAALFSRLIGALEKIEGYAPPAKEISLANLRTLEAHLKHQNKAVPDAEQELKLRQKERFDLYNDPKMGLNERMKGVKAAVCSQYGQKSGLWASVRGIRV